jgi:hypothetical protein
LNFGKQAIDDQMARCAWEARIMLSQAIFHGESMVLDSRRRGAVGQKSSTDFEIYFSRTGRIHVLNAYIQSYVLTDDPTPFDARKYFWKLAGRSGGDL